MYSHLSQANTTAFWKDILSVPTLKYMQKVEAIFKASEQHLLRFWTQTFEYLDK